VDVQHARGVELDPTVGGGGQLSTYFAGVLAHYCDNIARSLVVKVKIVINWWVHGAMRGQ
jgi:hypothetical protein